MPDRALDELLDQAIDAILARAPVEPSGGELDALVRIASALCEMPAKNFQSRLRTQLQRSASMTRVAASPVREGFRTITPYIMVPEGVKLIEFLERTFGAEELLRTPSPAGFHAEVRIGDSMLMIGSGESVRGRERIGAFHVYVPDCDAAYRRAMEAGATSMGEPAARPYGERRSPPTTHTDTGRRSCLIRSVISGSRRPSSRRRRRSRYPLGTRCYSRSRWIRRIEP